MLEIGSKLNLHRKFSAVHDDVDRTVAMAGFGTAINDRYLEHSLKGGDKLTLGGDVWYNYSAPGDVLHLGKSHCSASKLVDYGCR